MSIWWSVVLTAMGLTTVYLAGQRRTSAWVVGLTTQLAWASYAVATEQWGFLASVACYGAIYLRNLLAWRRADALTPPTADAPTPPTADAPTPPNAPAPASDRTR